MYICECCGELFPRPVPVEEGFCYDDGCCRRERRWVCPACGEGPIHIAHTCPCCGGWRQSGESLCPRCRERLKERFCAFIDGLTGEEKELLDDWLDGESVLACHRFGR